MSILICVLEDFFRRWLNSSRTIHDFFGEWLEDGEIMFESLGRSDTRLEIEGWKKMTGFGSARGRNEINESLNRRSLFLGFCFFTFAHEVVPNRIRTIVKYERIEQREFCFIDIPDRHRSNDSRSDATNIDAKKNS
jgi:hypothetical protein